MLYRTLLLCTVAFFARADQRVMQPEDLFRIRQVGAVAWSPDGQLAAIEFSRPGRALDSVPSNEIALLDVTAQSLRTLTSDAAQYLGFFNAVWSPDGRRLAFLSVDAEAVVRLWLWSPGSAVRLAANDLDVKVGFGDPPLVWLAPDRLAVVAWDEGAQKSGDLYFRILRGPNAARESVSVVESGEPIRNTPPAARLVSIDLGSGARKVLARGTIHHVQLSADRRGLEYRTETPGKAVAGYFGLSDLEDMYAAVNWGTEKHVLDLELAAEVPPAKRELPPVTVPRDGARVLSRAPSGDAVLFSLNAADGSHLWLGNKEIWRGNEWIADIKPGKPELVEYKALDGTALTAWLLLPPDHAAGTKLPMVTVIYPGTMHGAALPYGFSIYDAYFESPQVLVGLGYAVLSPSMPPPKDASDAHALDRLTNGVLPAVDAAVARGMIDPERVAVLGQSNGGFATIGILTQTRRFRSAIASAGFSDLVSLYGTFYGQYRHGDAGPPLKGQSLRMLQMERGDFALGGPPWAEGERYRAGSAILHAGDIQTPLMLVHGDLDFVPFQQDEEMFTALYRQGKRAKMVRYQGEWHTIAGRANVLDLWQRISSWLNETLK